MQLDLEFVENRVLKDLDVSIRFRPSHPGKVPIFFLKQRAVQAEPAFTPIR